MNASAATRAAQLHARLDRLRATRSIWALLLMLSLGGAFEYYQSELFPRAIRARAVGFVYSWSRFSAIFTSLVIGFLLNDAGVTGVFVFIAAAMAVAGGVVGSIGPRTSGLALEQIAD